MLAKIALILALLPFAGLGLAAAFC